MDIGAIAIGIFIAAVVVGAAVWVLGTLFAADMPNIERLLWLLIILMFPLVGALVWLSWGRDALRQRLDTPPGDAAAFRTEKAPR